MKSKLSQLKAIVPFLTLTAAAPAALANVDCYGSQTKISFWQHRPGSPQNFMTIDHLVMNGMEFWGGTYSIAGIGPVSEDRFDVDVTTTYTGSSEHIKRAHMTGARLQDGTWRVEFTPVNPATGKLDLKSKQLLACTQSGI